LRLINVCVNIKVINLTAPYGVRDCLEVLIQHNYKGSLTLIVACMPDKGHNKQLGGHPPVRQRVQETSGFTAQVGSKQITISFPAGLMSGWKIFYTLGGTLCSIAFPVLKKL